MANQELPIQRRGGVDVTIAQWIHLAGGSLAAGSMFFIIFALLPSMGTLNPSQQGALMGELFPRARLIFWTAIIFLSLGGLYLTIVGSSIRSFDQLFGTTYGRVLTVKILLALVVSTLALLLTEGTDLGVAVGLSWLGVGLLALAAWYGGELVYVHRVGVREETGGVDHDRRTDATDR